MGWNLRQALLVCHAVSPTTLCSEVTCAPDTEGQAEATTGQGKAPRCPGLACCDQLDPRAKYTCSPPPITRKQSSRPSSLPVRRPPAALEARHCGASGTPQGKGVPGACGVRAWAQGPQPQRPGWVPRDASRRPEGRGGPGFWCLPKPVSAPSPTASTQQGKRLPGRDGWVWGVLSRHASTAGSQSGKTGCPGCRGRGPRQHQEHPQGQQDTQRTRTAHACTHTHRLLTDTPTCSYTNTTRTHTGQECAHGHTQACTQSVLWGQ